MSQPRLLSLVSITLALLFLAACSNTSPDPDPDPEPEVQSYDVVVHDPHNANPFALTFMMVSPAAFTVTSPMTSPPDEISAASLAEVNTGFFVGNAVNIDEASQATFVIPAADDVPNAVMRPVGQAFSYVNNTVDCEVQSDDDTANVSYSYFDEVVAPGPLGFSFSAIVALASDEEINVDTFTTDGALLYTWLYSDSDVSVTFEGAGCGNLAADIDLSEGWNTLLLDYDPAASGLTLTNVEEPEMLHITVVSP